MLLKRASTSSWFLTLLACFTVAAAHAMQPPLKLAPQPLAFEPNQGQTSDQVAYVARGKGYILFLEPTEAVLSLKTPSAPKVLRMRLLDASPQARIQGNAALPGRHNYYIGNDPKRWHTGIPTYGKVLSKGVYPGIDMIYHGKEGRLEYDFMVAPHADPHAIRLAFAGDDSMAVNAQGDLILKVGGERVVHRAPYAYQTIHGTEVPVDAAYAIKGKTVSIKLGHYDTTKPLIIDPALIYASYLGGTGDDEARAIAVDGSGNIYLTGQTASLGFPGFVNSSYGGNSDAFVTMLDSSGAVIFSTYLGSSGSIGPSDPNDNEPSGEKANGIALYNGKIYVTGGTASLATSTTFPTTANAYQTCGTSVNSVFVSILNNDGSLDYSTCVGTANGEEGLGIAVDDAGNAYVVGWTNAGQSSLCMTCTFPVTSGAIQTTKKTDVNLRDSFFFKLTPSGSGANDLVYSTYLGSTQDSTSSCCNTYATAVTVDSNRVAYVAGWTNNASTGVLAAPFETALSAAGSTYSGLKDAFFYKIDPTKATPLLYATYLGGSGNDTATGIAIDTGGNVYLTGQTTSSNFPTLNANQASFKGGTTMGDAFVAKFSSTGINTYSLGYSTYLGGSDEDNANAIAVDSTTGRAYVTGQTHSTDFPTASTSGLQSGYSVLPDAFVTSLNAVGTANYSSYLGGTGGDQGLGITVSQDGLEKVYVAGGTSSTDFPVTTDAAQSTNQGGSGSGTDAFIAVIGTVADVGITLSGTNPAPPLLGTMTYTVAVTNNGPDTATGVLLTLGLSSPSSTTPLDNTTLSYDNNSLCTADAQENFTCNLGSMASGNTTTLTFSGQLTAADEVTATATVFSNEKDIDSTNDTAAWVSTAGQTTSTPPINVPGGGGSSGGGGGGFVSPYALLTLFAVLLLGGTRRYPGKT